MANQTERVDHLAAALRYASQGVLVFPLAPRSKFPLISAANDGHGLLDATTDAAQIQAWWMAAALTTEGQRLGLGLHECERTVASGMSAGTERPRGLAIG
jgi:hypothetical protein